MLKTIAVTNRMIAEHQLLQATKGLGGSAPEALLETLRTALCALGNLASGIG